MKHLFYKAVSTFLLATNFIIVHSQVQDTLQTNNVSALVLSNGVLFSNATNSAPGFEVPFGEGVHTIFASGAWFGGIPTSGEDTVMVSGSMFYVHSDWNNGPLTTNGQLSIDPNGPNEYAQIWHAKRSDLNELFAYQQAYMNGTLPIEFPDGYNMPVWISNWPANGNTMIDQPVTLAPFADTDGDNIYNPWITDYPLFYGDECSYMILNDLSLDPTCSDGTAMGIEVHLMVYSFDSMDEVTSNTVFARYTCVNRGQLDFNDFYVGMWTDTDIGTSYDDFIGCNVEKGYFFGYNGDDFDEPTLASAGYGYEIPVQVMSFILGPLVSPDGIDNTLPEEYEGYNSYGKYGIGYNDGIVDNEHWGMSTYRYYGIGQNPINGDPMVDTDFYNYMSDKWKNGTPVVYGGNGTNTSPGATSIPCKYMFPGSSDPLKQGTNGISVDPWDEITTMNLTADKRGVGAIGPLTFSSHDTLSFDVAFLNVSNPSAAVDIWNHVDSSITALTNFYIESPMVEISNFIGPFTAVENLINTKKADLVVYPNPTMDFINFSLPAKEKFEVSIFNQLGQMILSKISSGEFDQIDVSSLPEGIYEIHIQNKNILQTAAFIKKNN